MPRKKAVVFVHQSFWKDSYKTNRGYVSRCEKKLKGHRCQIGIFSVALDESTDLKGTAQLAVFVRGLIPSLDNLEKFVQSIPMKSATRGEDISKALQTLIAVVKLDFSKLTGITKDGAPVMVGQKKKCRFSSGKTNKRPWNFHKIKKNPLYYS